MAGSADTGASLATPHTAGLHFQLYSLGIEAPVRWRLLSGNNRDMGRGSAEWASETDCRSAIDTLVGRLDRLEPSLVRTADGRWGWRLSLDGDAQVVSGHGFDRRTRCEQASLRFVQLAGEAELRHGVTLLIAVRRPEPTRLQPVGHPSAGMRWPPVHRGSATWPYGSGSLTPQPDQQQEGAS